jgi:hypothetical protein
MEPRLTRGEYWLLNCVVEAGCPVKFLVSDDIEELFNKRGHLMERQRLIETLCELHSRGWIKSDRGEIPVLLDSDQIEAALVEEFDSKRDDQGVYFRLTEEGGAAWERFAAPRWDRYLRTRLSFSKSTGAISGATKWRVEKYLSLVHHLGTIVDPNSIVRQVLAPYQATYWKTLPIGYRVEYRYSKHHEQRDWERVPHSLMSLQRWYDWE